MTIKLTTEIIERNRRLARSLASGNVPVNDLREHLESIDGLTIQADPVKRNVHKADRKEIYKHKLKRA